MWKGSVMRLENYQLSDKVIQKDNLLWGKQSDLIAKKRDNFGYDCSCHK